MSFPITTAEAQLLNKMNSTARRVGLGDLLNFQVIESAASAGGSASEALTFTGLAVTDTILAISQRVAGANGTAVTGYNTQAANALTVTWTANPGAGARVRILVAKAAV